MTEKIERAFTRADVEAYFQQNWGQSKPRCELTDIRLVRGATPPLWLVSYNMHSDFGDSSLIALIKQEAWVHGPALNIEIPTQLPVGFATPAEEDAEMDRLWQSMVEKHRKKQAGQQESEP